MPDLDAKMRAADAKRAERYFKSREDWIRNRLPVHIQDPFAVLVLEDMIRVFRAFVKAAPRTQTRLKYCTSACCKGKPESERHGPYATTEWWDTSSGRGKWRTVPKSSRRAATLAVEAAMERAAGRPSRVKVGEPMEAPRPATREEVEAFLDALSG